MKTFKLFLALAIVVATSPSFAAGGTDVGVFFGMKNTEYDIDVAGVDTTAKTGIMAGAIAYGEMGGLSFRTGGYYSQRNSEVDISGTELQLKVSYLDVPVTVMYSFNDMFSVFGGAVLGLKVSDDCSGDSTACDSFSDDVKSFHAAAQLGLNAKFHPNWSGEIFYEHGLNDIAEDTSATALSAAVVFIY